MFPLQTGAEISVLININRLALRPEILRATCFSGKRQRSRLTVEFVFLNRKGRFVPLCKGEAFVCQCVLITSSVRVTYLHMLAVGSGYPLFLANQSALLGSDNICLAGSTGDGEGRVVLSAQLDAISTAALNSVRDDTSTGSSSLQSDSNIRLRGLESQQVLLPSNSLFLFGSNGKLFGIFYFIINIVSCSVRSDSNSTIIYGIKRFAVC